MELFILMLLALGPSLAIATDIILYNERLPISNYSNNKEWMCPIIRGSCYSRYISVKCRSHDDCQGYLMCCYSHCDYDCNRPKYVGNHKEDYYFDYEAEMDEVLATTSKKKPVKMTTKRTTKKIATRKLKTKKKVTTTKLTIKKITTTKSTKKLAPTTVLLLSRSTTVSKAIQKETENIFQKPLGSEFTFLNTDSSHMSKDKELYLMNTTTKGSQGELKTYYDYFQGAWPLKPGIPEVPSDIAKSSVDEDTVSPSPGERASKQPEQDVFHGAWRMRLGVPEVPSTTPKIFLKETSKAYSLSFRGAWRLKPGIPQVPSDIAKSSVDEETVSPSPGEGALKQWELDDFHGAWRMRLGVPEEGSSKESVTATMK